jgi:hypothetical protein
MRQEALGLVNKTMETLLISPFDNRKQRSEQAKLKKSSQISKRLLELAGVKSVQNESKPGEALMQRLVNEFHEYDEKSEKFKILTIAAGSSLNCHQLMSIFEIPQSLAQAAIDSFQRGGVLAQRQPKKGRALEESRKAEVLEFFESDDVSLQMPGRNDFVIVRSGGQKSYVQKRLMLFTLADAYKEYLELGKAEPVAFSTFVKLRPPNCVFPFSPNSLRGCICILHENPSLMLKGCGIDQISERFKSTSDCTKASMCEQPNRDCYLGLCESCPGIDKTVEDVGDILQAAGAQSVKFSQWTTEDGRCEIQQHETDLDDFLQKFSGQLEELRTHSYVAKQQSSFMDIKIETLQPGELVIILDYSENYAITVNFEVQSAHFSPQQATVHVIFVLYKDGEQTKQLNFVSISDHLQHGTAEVHFFLTRLYKRLEEKLPFKPKKVYYFTDNCAGQYKNLKNFYNLIFHEKDFGCEAEWHFFERFHGKGRCDGIGGACKRCAHRASHQRINKNQISSPLAFYEFLKLTMKKVEFDYSTKQDHIQHTAKLRRRFSMAVPIKGCRKQHAFIPVKGENKLKVKYLSFSDEYEVFDYDA